VRSADGAGELDLGVGALRLREHGLFAADRADEGLVVRRGAVRRHRRLVGVDAVARAD
jgi:hypothetical protein